MKLKEWLNKGDGGYSWYEPYLTNKDWVIIYCLCIFVCFIIIGGCVLINKFN
jgi:hypothetical protein